MLRVDRLGDGQLISVVEPQAPEAQKTAPAMGSSRTRFWLELTTLPFTRQGGVVHGTLPSILSAESRS